MEEDRTRSRWDGAAEEAEDVEDVEAALEEVAGAPRTGQEDGYFYLTLTPGQELDRDAAGMDYVFILDISGSMASDGKLQVSSDSVAAFVNALGETDRFEVMTFNNQPTTHFNALRAVSDEAMQPVHRVDFATARSKA